MGINAHNPGDRRAERESATRRERKAARLQAREQTASRWQLFVGVGTAFVVRVAGATELAGVWGPRICLRWRRGRELAGRFGPGDHGPVAVQVSGAALDPACADRRETKYVLQRRRCRPPFSALPTNNERGTYPLSWSDAPRSTWSWDESNHLAPFFPRPGQGVVPLVSPGFRVTVVDRM